MNKGSTRLTVRLGDDLIAAIKETVDRRNDGGVSPEHWTVSSYVVKAIEDKLNHDRRSARKDERVKAYREWEYGPMLFEEE